MRTTFRKVVKEASPGQVPVALADEIRNKAARERKSCSAVMTELVCTALQIDPVVFGLEAGSRRKPAPALDAN